MINSSTPKDKTLNLNLRNNTPSQKSLEEKEKVEKNNSQNNANKKALMPNFLDKNEISEKNFPQKVNYFNEKKNSIKSPIIDYFSPSFYLQKYHSPEEIHQTNEIYTNSNKSFNTRSVEQNFKKSPNINEQNFNFSPSNIFNNKNNNNNFIINSSSAKSQNNTKILNEKSNEEEENRPLQERIGILMQKNDSSNNVIPNNKNNIGINTYNNNSINPLSNIGLINNNYFNSNSNINMTNSNSINNNSIYNNNNHNINNINNNNQNNNQINEEEFDNQDNQDEVYILNLNSEDENDKDIDDDILNNNQQEKNNSSNKNNTSNKKAENDKNNFHKKIRNNIKEQLNNIINTGENEFPSYGGAVYQNNNNNNQNINNNNNNNDNIQNINNNNNNIENNKIKNSDILINTGETQFSANISTFVIKVIGKETVYFFKVDCFSEITGKTWFVYHKYQDFIDLSFIFYIYFINCPINLKNIPITKSNIEKIITSLNYYLIFIINRPDLFTNKYTQNFLKLKNHYPFQLQIYFIVN